jgi:hypothetical protein
VTPDEVHLAAELSQSSLERTDNVVGYMKLGTKTLKAISVPLAFRKYTWLKLAPVVNKAGNYRGIIVNSHWKTVYQITTEATDAIEKYSKVIGGTAAIASGLLSTWDEVDKIVHSKSDRMTKAAMLSTQVSSAALRAAFGASDLAVVSPLLTGLAYSCGAANSALGGHLAFLDQCREHVSTLNRGITAKFMALTDGQAIYNFIQLHLVFN